MANYGVLYVFRFESANKTNIEIQILKKDYRGARTYRSLGRAPILKREKSGCVHGSSLELYAECQVDGEFASLYTSSADEYKVEIYKIDELLGATFQRRVWTGFVSPELYSEPDIAPPYDVQIIATDGLGELKNYIFEARGLHSVQDHLEYMLGHTGLSQEFNVVSFMAGDSGTVPIMDVTVSLDHMAGESCYDVLKAVLDSFHAEIACQDGYWMIWRETDLVNLTSQVEVAEFGSQTKTDWWPVGQLSTVIEPAKKRVTVISEDAYKDNVLKDVPYHAYGATYDSEEKAFILPTAGTSVLKTLSFGAEVGYKLSLTVTARNVGSGDEGQPIGIKVKIGGRSYIVGDTFWLRERTDGKTSWTNTEGVIEKMLEAPSVSNSAKDAQTIALELPLYSYSNRVYHYATSVEVTIFNTDGEYPIHVYDVTLSKLDQIKGYKAVLEIDNGAREEADEANLIIADNDRIPVAADIFMNGIALNAAESPISSWASGRLASMGYLAFMSRDYALSVALPRMKVQGVLNVPASALITPVLFLRDNTYYFPETYNYDLLNDELSVSLVSIPTAQIEVVSEEVTEAVDPFQSRPGGSAGGGSSSGGSSGGGAADITIDTEMSDTSVNAVQNKVIKKYVDDADTILEDAIGNLAERIDSLENGTSGGAVIFDATTSADPWSLNDMKTQTTYEEIAEAINAGRPIYMRFMSGLVAIVNAELYDSGDISLYAHLVDPESHVLRTIHTYGNSDSWSWEAFDESYASGSSSPSNVAIDFQGLYALISLSPGVADAEMAAVGLTTEVISGILEARYNKAIGAGDDREVWNYDGWDGGNAINIFFRQGDGFDVLNAYSLRRDVATGYWTIYYTEM